MDNDVLKFVTALIANTKGDGKEGDEFWTKAETLLYCALVSYIVFEGPEEERNMNTLVEMISSMEVREDDETFKNAVDYMLIRVLEENASNEKLEALKEHYSKPISTENELGTFVLEREFSWFEGSINWNGVEANVYLETDEEDGDTAEQAMAVLKSVIENIVDNDNKYREFAAQELTGLANEWLSESDESDVEEITQETFAKRMEISEVTVSPDGSLSLIYHDDDMFWGHVIEIIVEPNGEIISANIAG